MNSQVAIHCDTRIPLLTFDAWNKVSCHQTNKINAQLIYFVLFFAKWSDNYFIIIYTMVKLKKQKKKTIIKSRRIHTESFEKIQKNY